jgi:conjugal transfer pilus assembly protein TraW
MLFFRVFLVILCVFPLQIWADEFDFLKNSQDIIKSADQQTVPDWLNQNEKAQAVYGEAAETIYAQSSSHVASQMGLDFNQDRKNDDIERRLVFISFSIPRNELNLILEAAGDYGLTVVLRGLPEGIKTLPELIRGMNKLSESIDGTPEVILDPELFKDFEVDVAPSYVYVNEDGGSVRAEGAVSFPYVERKSDMNRDLNLGRVGNVWDIAEKDFIQEIKNRMSVINFEGKAQSAYSNFWKSRNFFQLPQAVEYKRRILSPEFKVNSKITTPKGPLPFKVGSVINPLSHMEFNQKLIIFNPLDEKELSFARQVLAMNPYAKEKIIVTQIDPDRGWDHLRDLENSFNRKVYLLAENLATKFKVRYTPTTIHAENKKFVILEYGPSDMQDIIDNES